MSILLETKEELLKRIDISSITVERAVVGIFFTGVKLSTGHGGMCATPVKAIPAAVCCPSSAKEMPFSGKMEGRSIEWILDQLDSTHILLKTIAIAALNALSAMEFEKGGYEIDNETDSFDTVELRKDSTVVVVGALVPIIRKALQAECELYILEKDPSTLKRQELEHFVEADRFKEVVPKATHLIITGTTLINDTLDGLLAAAPEDADIIVTGPTSSMIPDVFFRSKVKKLGGDIVRKPDECLDILSEAGSGYHLFGKSTEKILIQRN